MRRKLSEAERRLSALQYSALKQTCDPGGARLLECDARAVATLLRRSHIDRMGSDGAFVATARGRYAASYYETHIGTAKR